MELDIVSYIDICDLTSSRQKIETALLTKGIIGVSGVPDFEKLTRRYISACQQFSKLPDHVKNQYAPNRDNGETEGYELGAERFKNKNGEWLIDDKKASYYAFVPEDPRNVWPKEIDLKTPYLALGKLIFETGKILLNAIGLNESVGLIHDQLQGYGRMLHYHKESQLTNDNPNWCGAHLDHGVFTGLVPAYYFQNEMEVDEPSEAGLFITPSNGNSFEKIYASDKSILLFQVGEFGQLISNDRIKATRHLVKKAFDGIERYTFALFYSAGDQTTIRSQSILTSDARYQDNQSSDGSITYDKWQKASFARYRAL